MSARTLVLVLFAALPALPAADPLAAGVTRKLDLIESGRAPAGAVIRFTSAELNAWVRASAPEVAPDGFRQPRLVLGDGTATGYALVDFLRLRHSAGLETNWLVAKLIEGEKPVMAMARIDSSRGQATVHLLRVEIGGLAVSGAPLDFLIRNFFLPLYPNAQIDQPFQLADGIERIEVAPGEARVFIRQSRRK